MQSDRPGPSQATLGAHSNQRANYAWNNAKHVISIRRVQKQKISSRDRENVDDEDLHTKSRSSTEILCNAPLTTPFHSSSASASLPLEWPRERLTLELAWLRKAFWDRLSYRRKHQDQTKFSSRWITPHSARRTVMLSMTTSTF